MKLLITSDTHGNLPSIDSSKEYDVFCLVGDVCPNYSAHWIADADLQMNWMLDKFVPWLRTINAKRKLITFGNHDGVGLHPEIRSIFDADTQVLIDQSTTIDGVLFHGTPWTFCPPEYGLYRWAYGKSYESELKLYFDQIPDNTQVLLSHGPPYGILDATLHTGPLGGINNIGSHELGKSIIRKNIPLTIFGHNHCGTGKYHTRGFNFINTAQKLSELDIQIDFDKNIKL